MYKLRDDKSGEMIDLVQVRNLGQLREADISLGDLTVLVGPQASGKSIFLQTVKLTLDYQNIARTIRQQGFDWKEDPNKFLALYFGEGMQELWTEKTRIEVNGEPFDLADSLETSRRKKTEEKLFLIPAQRVITLRNGWPRAFLDYEMGDPYVVRQFSEHLRRLMEAGLGSGKNAIFPQAGRLNKDLRDAINQSIFSDAEVRLDASEMRKRIVLKVNESLLPFMVWSAGQREFIPLLLGLYALMPSAGASKKRAIDWVVIEEPEMGLHPQAISALLLLVLELLHRKYRVIISTHSPQVLELVWAIRMLQDTSSTPEQLLQLFDLHKTPYLQKMAEANLGKTFHTYYFERTQTDVTVRDISELAPDHPDEIVADWGGLTGFSTRVSEVISQAVRDSQG